MWRHRVSTLATIATLVLLTGSLRGQEIEQRDGTVVLIPQRADSVNVVTSVSLRQTDSVVRYVFTLRNRAVSAQDLHKYGLEVSRAAVESTAVPTGWRVSFPAQDQRWRQLFGRVDSLATLAYVGLGPGARLKPGESAGGFKVTSRWLPGLTPSWVQGFIPVPKVPFGAEPDSIVGGSLFENSVSDTTIGPVVPPEAVDEPAAIVGQMEELLGFACRREWIDNRGICNSLTRKLQQVGRSIERGRAKTARNQLRAFRSELEAQRGKHVDESAFSVLDLYARRLAERL